ncbi:MAG TPA: argininosuccinate lyase [Anaerolineaceae bacterium]|nr:argininosuccinate lyase [Anaerolineaceae bacterium]
MKLWGGRFSDEPDALAFRFNASLTFDWRLAPYDIQGSIAWANGLAAAGVLTGSEAAEIIRGLELVLHEVESETFAFQPADEDVHTAVERRLTELIGPVAGKLHTGRSRNDQVVTDFRLWMMSAIDAASLQLQELQSALLARAESDFGLLINGYTHFQRAQPILLSHWWLSHFWPLAADRQRLAQLRQRTSVLPLGSGALAGVPYPVDRALLAQALGFEQVSPNSLFAVSDRDFVAEFLFCCSLVAVHLSRLSEALILYSTAEYGFIELSEAYSTGSSLMPQKKNPDPLELSRAKAGTLLGRLSGFLAVLKGLPSAYDKDLQEDKQPAFEASDTLALMLPVISGCIRTLTVHPDRIQAALDPALLATDLADYLVRKGIPFRKAHHLVGKVVQRARQLNVAINQLPLVEFRQIDPAFDEYVFSVFDFNISIALRSAPGGTAPDAVKAQIDQAKAVLS